MSTLLLRVTEHRLPHIVPVYDSNPPRTVTLPETVFAHDEAGEAYVFEVHAGILVLDNSPSEL